MASNVFTTGRTELLSALQADATLAERVRTWYDWGPGLRRRYDIEPAACPLLSLVPASLAVEELSNIADRVPQDVEIGIVTDGPDAEPCELLVTRALHVLETAREGALLGLSDDGLVQIDPVTIRWDAVPTEKGARVRWEAIVIVRLTWYLRSFV